MKPSDLTVRILREIRDEQRGTRADMQGIRGEMQGLRGDMRAMSERFEARFEVIETTLRDLAQQLVVRGRAIKVAIDDRRESIDRWDDHERGLVDLERRLGAGH